MIDQPANASSPWDALKRRKLVQWLLAYAAGAWVVLQVLGFLASAYAWPVNVLRIGTGVVITGLPIAFVLAWYHGERGEQRIGRTEIVILIVLLALGGGALWRVERGAASQPEAASDATTTAAPAAGAPSVSAKSIAVLPFENLSNNADNAYFVSGMQDLILTNLAKISDLKVISRTSTEKYASRPDNLKTVGVELGVANLLEGSVQRAGDQVLINLQLIEAKSDTHLWAESYNRKIEDIFSVEQEVAKTVAAALQAKLSPSETAAIARKPTGNSEAYELFLRAQFLEHLGFQNEDRAALLQSVDLYQQAVALDPGFALALARLSIARSNLYWYAGGDVAALEKLADLAQEAAQQASRLQPDLPEAHIAVGNERYRVRLDFPAGLAAFEAALALRPSDADALYGRAMVLRRQGRFDDSMAVLRAAIAVSPRDSNLESDLAESNWMARQFPQADAAYRRSLELDPGNLFSLSRLSTLRIYGYGDSDGAMAVLQGDKSEIQAARLEVLRFGRKYDEALHLLQSIPESAFGPYSGLKQLSKGRLLIWAGRRAEALPILEQATHALEAAFHELPQGYFRQTARRRWAEAEAWLGHEALALKLEQEAMDDLPPDRDAVEGVDALGDAASTYAVLGRTDLVLATLERIRKTPGSGRGAQAVELRLDPFFDKVRSESGFTAEIERFAALEQR